MTATTLTGHAISIAYWLIVTIGGGGLIYLIWRESRIWWAEMIGWRQGRKHR